MAPQPSGASGTLHRLGVSFATELDEQKLLQLITDEATALTGAQFGSFFFNVTDDKGDAYMLYTLSGAPKEAFQGFPMPRATPLFAPTFRGEGTIRLDDVRADPRFGQWGPQPSGHLKVVSYLAVPVIARSGEVLGGLFFGHAEAGRFTAEHAMLVEGIAAHASVALENARLYGALQKSQQAAREAYERAADADRRKDEFLAMLGHELRNPLAPITTALELIRLRGAGKHDRELSVIERQVRHLTRLVDDLLDISRITRGKIELAREPLELASVVARGIEMASPLIEQRRHVLSVDVPPTGLLVSGDAVRLAQVVSNLLNNAARYTDPGGRLRISAQRVESHVVLRVRDNGIGIGSAMLPTVFDLFTQAPQSIDRAQGGLGLGLTLVRSLVELHGGGVRAHSQGAGTGTEIEVRLPVLEAAELPPATEAPPAKRPERIGEDRRVLVVDDSQDSADMVASALRTAGYVVEVAYDAARALDIAGTRPFDLAVLDIGLPVLDGYQLARRLRRLPGGAGMRLVALTGYGQDGDRKRTAEAGFDHHLVKPIDLDKLLQVARG